MNQEYFLKLVKLYTTANVFLELLTQIQGSKHLKFTLKNKVKSLEKELEKAILPYVDKLYETDANLSQGIEMALNSILDDSVEGLVKKWDNGNRVKN